jgi:hypothetical protein
VKIADIVKNDDKGKLINVNLDIKNPNRKGEFEYREPAELAKSIIEREKDIFSLMKEIEKEIKIALSYEG